MNRFNEFAFDRARFDAGRFVPAARRLWLKHRRALALVLNQRGLNLDIPARGISLGLSVRSLALSLNQIRQRIVALNPHDRSLFLSLPTRAVLLNLNIRELALTLEPRFTVLNLAARGTTSLSLFLRSLALSVSGRK